VLSSPTAEDALSLLKERMPDIIFLDVWLPEWTASRPYRRSRDGEGHPVSSYRGTVISSWRSKQPDSVHMTSLKNRFLWTGITCCARALERRKLELENRTLKADLGRKMETRGRLRKDALTQQQIEMASQSSSRVLIPGRKRDR